MLATHVNEILKLRRAITVDTAKHLAIYFGMAAMYWVSLQVSYDLSRHKIEPVQAIIF
jgi:plasmid maintenance system antidote protein VapI